MKLKKIASLALAGIMAVSMLTACDTTSNEQPTQPEQPTTPATGYSATVQKKLSPIAKAKLTLSDDAKLDDALDYAVGFASPNKIGDWYINEDGMAIINTANNTSAGDVAEHVIEVMDANKDGLRKGDASEIKGFLSPSPANFDKNDQDIVFTYIINGHAKMNNVLELVAEDISDNIMDELSVVYNVGGGNNSEVPYYYTGSVSAKTVDLDDGHGVSATFVAVELVRHIGK